MGSIESLSIMMETIFACTSVALLTSGGRTSRQKQVTRRPDERCGVVRSALQLPHLAGVCSCLQRKGEAARDWR